MLPGFRRCVNLLMLAAWAGRLLAGSIPLPADSPFETPAGLATSGHATLMADLTGSLPAKDLRQHATRPWYGLLAPVRVVLPAGFVLLFPVAFSHPPSAVLIPVPRPPSCARAA